MPCHIGLIATNIAMGNSNSYARKSIDVMKGSMYICSPLSKALSTNQGRWIMVWNFCNNYPYLSNRVLAAERSATAFSSPVAAH